MQEPHDRDRHHPPRLIHTALAAAFVALALTGSAAAAQYAALPSPTAPLSPEPPLGPATASAEGIRHRVSAVTHVAVSVDGSGEPFAVTATQRLDVRVTGDYSFAIGAPVTGATAGPGSQSQPGFRTGAIVWAGFDPGRRVLAVRATLDPAQTRDVLPVRISVAHGRTTLVNATGVTATAYTADALRAPLLTYLHQLARALASGNLPLTGGAQLTSPPVAARVTVRVPFRVSGTVGGHHVDLALDRRAVVPYTGRIDLDFAVAPRGAFGPPAAVTGRQLLALATRLSLTAARARQYEEFLGNPDPTGRSTTSYTYRTAPRPVAAAPVVRAVGRDWTRTLLVAAGLAAVLGAGALVWSRS